MQKFNRKELSQNNGKDGAKTFVAYKGKVYDVSDSFHWKNGKHQVLHKAGEDLTDALAQAPHGEDMLEKYPVVEVLNEESDRFAAKS